MAFITCLGWCCLLIHPGERKRHQWKHRSSSFAIKWKARNLSFQKYKSNRKSKHDKLFQEVQKKIFKKADYFYIDLLTYISSSLLMSVIPFISPITGMRGSG